MRSARILVPLLAAAEMFAQRPDFITQVQNKPMIDAREYDWYRTNGISSSGTLTSAGSAAISITRCPLGPLAVGDKVYISGGTGTAEAVAITATTCDPGDASGTITVTTANTHSGAWKIGSASTGLQEAINTALLGSVKGVRLPSGTVPIHATVLIVGSNVTLEGDRGTVLTADNAVSPVIQAGTASGLASRVWLRDMQVTRTSTPPAGSIGVQWYQYSYCGKEGVLIRNHAIGEKFGPTPSLGFDAIASQVDHATEAYLVYENAIEVTWHGGYLGVNAGTTDAPPKAIIIKGVSDTVRFLGTSIIPRGTGTLWIASFEAYTGTNGLIIFDDVNSENIAGGFTSDASTPLINEIAIRGSRIALSATAPLFSFNAATSVTNLKLEGNTMIWSQVNLANVAWARIVGNYLLGTGGTFTGGTGSHLVYSNNTVVSSNTFTGAWRNISITGNTWHNSNPTISATAIATGGISVLGNTSNTGTAIPNSAGVTSMAGRFSPVNIVASEIGSLTDSSYPNGSIFYCTNCDTSCVGSGTGALVVKKNGAAVCY